MSSWIRNLLGNRSLRCVLFLAGLLFALSSACTRQANDDKRTFLLRTSQPDVPKASVWVLDVVASQLSESGSLDDGYPQQGYIEYTPDPADQNDQIMHCVSNQPQNTGMAGCILLDDVDDFIRIQPITWQSAAFFMVRVYIAPRSLLFKVDPTRDFVALDVFIAKDENLWHTVDDAIRAAMKEIGARPFRP